MISRHVRFALLGGLFGLLIALTPGCKPKCGPSNCAGCCASETECVGTVTDAQCGAAGASCGACSADQECKDGACAAKPVEMMDAGMKDAGPPPCANDFDCAEGQICDGMGKCVAGTGCGADFECQSFNAEDRCYRYGQQCVCDTRADDGGVASRGTCRVRKSPCTECESDLECGPDTVIFGPPDGIGAGRCKALPGDMSGKKYCSYQRVGQCACGTIDDGTGYCRPQSNTCDQVGCNIDKDCPAGAVCSVNRPDAGVGSCGGICVPRCRWDFGIKDNVAPGCPPGKTCWVDQKNLDPQSLYYGAGRCMPPCQSTSECAFSGSNPFGGADLVCEAEKLSDGTDSQKRCRARGECMDNLECPELDAGQPYLGYCDRGTFACETDCRVGNDPITNLPYKDCRSPYACTRDAGVNYCRLETCVEQGGAGIACAQGEYCCGDDKNFDGVADPCPPLAEQNAAGCYKAPAPPFCTECGVGADLTMPDQIIAADNECAQLQGPSWVNCSNGSDSPNCSPLKPKCMYAGDRMAQGDGINVCMMPSVNSIGSVNLRYGATRKDQIACPTNYTPQNIRPQPNPGMDAYCQSNDDCRPKGADGGFIGDGGICEPDPQLRLPDGGLVKACRCEAGSVDNHCPNGSGYPTGIVTSFCKDALPGTRSFCVESVVCRPPGRSVYQPTTEFGCGL